MTQLDLQVSNALNALAIEHSVFVCDPEFADTAAFCEKYDYKPDQSANTILVVGKGEPKKFAACVVLATTKLDVNKKVCELLEVKRASFANAEQTKELTGMMIGGVTIFGLPAKLPIFIDSRVIQQEEIVMGGGNRSSKILLNPKELSKIPSVNVVADLAFMKE